MSTVIELERLCDAYIKRDDWGSCEQPDLFRFTLDDVEWVSDRRWILRRDVLSFNTAAWDVSDLGPAKNVHAAQEWVRAALTADLGDCHQRFMPCFSGVLTHAGVRAHGVAGQPWAALVTTAGERIGLLMPWRELDGAVGLPIPAPDHVCDLARRVGQVVGINLADAWRVAAHLSAENPS